MLFRSALWGAGLSNDHSAQCAVSGGAESWSADSEIRQGLAWRPGLSGTGGGSPAPGKDRSGRIEIVTMIPAQHCNDKLKLASPFGTGRRVTAVEDNVFSIGAYLLTSTRFCPCSPAGTETPGNTMYSRSMGRSLAAVLTPFLPRRRERETVLMVMGSEQ